MIQSLTPTDAEALAELYLELTGKPTNLEKMKVNLSLITENKDYYLLGVKDEKGQLLGALMGVVCQDVVGSCRPFMVLENVIVTEKRRGQGIGSQLIKRIERLAQKRGCYYIEFVSSVERKAAHKFYETLEYKPNVVQGFKKYLADLNQ